MKPDTRDYQIMRKAALHRGMRKLPNFNWIDVRGLPLPKQDNSKFDKYPNVFNHASAAVSFANGFDSARVAVKVGRKFVVVTPAFAKRMKLKVVK